MDGRQYYDSLRRLRLFAGEAELTPETVGKIVQPFIEEWRLPRVPNRKDHAIPMDSEFMLSTPALTDLAARIRVIGMNLNKSGLKGIHYHNGFQRHLAALANTFDCRGWTESAALFDDPKIDGGGAATVGGGEGAEGGGGPLQLAGRVDVIWTRTRPVPSSLSQVAVAVFEIDSTVKARSFQKLKEAAAAHKLWVYFGADVWGFRTFLQKNDPQREIIPVIVPRTFIPSFDDDPA